MFLILRKNRLLSKIEQTRRLTFTFTNSTSFKIHQIIYRWNINTQFRYVDEKNVYLQRNNYALEGIAHISKTV